MMPNDRVKLKIEADYRERQGKVLERQLLEALREYEQEDLNSRREGVLVALSVVLDHVHKELRVDRSTTRPLGDLWNAIWDVDRGARNELLIPRKSGRPPLSSPQLDLHHAVAIAIDLRMMAGDNKELAARYVARKMQSFDIDLGGKPDKPAWEIIAEWRDNLSAARLHGSPEHLHFSGFLYHYEKLGLQDAVKEHRRDPNEMLTSQFKKIQSLRSE